MGLFTPKKNTAFSDNTVVDEAYGRVAKSSPFKVSPNKAFTANKEVESTLSKMQPISLPKTPTAPAITPTKATASISPIPAKAPATSTYSPPPREPAPAPSPSTAPMSGFASADPTVQDRLKQMQQKTMETSSYAPAPSSAPVSMASLSQPEAPAAPTMSESERRLREIYGQVSGLSGRSEEERALADQLTSFRESAELGITGLEGQGRGIPLGLVRGQQGKLQQQAAIKEGSLMDRLSLAQQDRQAQLQAAQTEFGFEQQMSDIAAQEQAAAAAANKPFEMGGNLIALNPETGQYEMVYQSPGETGPQKIGDRLVQLNPETGQYEEVYAPSQGPMSAIDQAELAYKNAQIAKIEADINKTSDPMERERKTLELESLRREAAEARGDISSQEDRQAALATIQSTTGTMATLNDVLNSPALDARVGIQAFMPAIPGTAGATFDAKLKQLKSQQTLEGLDALRGLGAMSERELATVVNAIGTLDKKLPQKEFRAELQRIQGQLQQAQDKAHLISQGYSTQDAQEFVLGGGLTNDLSTSIKGIEQTFPQETISTFKRSNGAARSECGEWINDLTGLGVGDSFQSKLNKMDSSINPSNAQPGDVFMTPYKGYGHIGFINQVSQDAQGNPIFRVSESNYKKRNGIGIVTHDRWVTADQMSGFSRPGFSNSKYSNLA